MRIVEEVAFDAPSLVVDLFPDGTRLDIDFPVIELQRTESRFRRTASASSWRVIGRRSRPGVTLAIEDLFAIEGDRVVVHIFQNFVDLPFAEVELLNSLT